MNMGEARNFTSDSLRGNLREGVDMGRLTSWRAGGVAERMYQPADLADLAAFLRTLPADEPLLALGLGSNLLVRDGGLRGTVLLLHAALEELRVEAEGTLYVQAGVVGAKLARFAALHSLGGAEFFAGIPGTLGGMLAMNAGCYGSETWDVVERVQVMDRRGVLHERSKTDYEIGYRHVERIEDRGARSEERGAGIEERGSSSDRYEALPVSTQSPARSTPPDTRPAGGLGAAPIPNPQSSEFFVGAWLKLPAGDEATARAAIKVLLAKRIASQPLNLPNAGSVFRNPPGDHAARLIEACGLKGQQIGGARVSEKHANFIVNVGGASAADIENLIAEVQATVKKQMGVELHPEVRIVGAVNG